jgi:hypothetical protein
MRVSLGIRPLRPYLADRRGLAKYASEPLLWALFGGAVLIVLTIAGLSQR